MTHDKPVREDQMTRLLDRSMRSVTASDDLVAGAVSRGRRTTRRRRTAQAAGVGAAAALATLAAVVTPSLLDDGPGAGPGARPPVAAATDGAATTVAEPSRGPTSPTSPTSPSSPSSPDPLRPSVQGAQALLREAIPDPVPDPGVIVRVDYDPDGRGPGEITAILTTGASDILARQDARCDRVAASAAPDDCLDTGDGWVFSGPSSPDISGNDDGLAGVRATFIRRDGTIVDLAAYNATKVVDGNPPTRPDPVLDADELLELATRTAWFG